jgi:hypothetical protein
MPMTESESKSKLSGTNRSVPPKQSLVLQILQSEAQWYKPKTDAETNPTGILPTAELRVAYFSKTLVFSIQHGACKHCHRFFLYGRRPLSSSSCFPTCQRAGAGRRPQTWAGEFMQHRISRKKEAEEKGELGFS